MTSRRHEQCFAFDAEPREIRKCVREGHPVLIVLRGVTGSGKTHLAKQFMSASSNAAYWTVEHPHLTRSVRGSVSQDSKSLVIVDAEHVERRSIKEFARIALGGNYELYVIEPSTEWRYDAEKCADLGSRGESMESIGVKIQTILEESIGWEHLVPGGEKNVQIVNYHDDDDDEKKEEVNVVMPMSPARRASSNTPADSATPQFFSLMPKKTIKNVRSVGTQVKPDSIVRSLADVAEWPTRGCVDVGVETSVEQTPKTLRMIDRCLGAPEDVRRNGQILPADPLIKGTSEEVGFALIRSVFTSADMQHIHHFLQIFGFEHAYQIMDMTGEVAELDNLPTDDAWLHELLTYNMSQTTGNWTPDDEIADLRRQYEEMKLRQRRVVDDDVVETSSDEQIARILHEDEVNNRAEQQPEEKALSLDDEANIEHLRLVFPAADALLIVNAYKVAGRDASLAAEILRDEGVEENLRARRAPAPRLTWSRVAATTTTTTTMEPSLINGPPKSAAEKANHFLQPRAGHNRLNLNAAQKLAAEQRVHIEHARGANRHAIALTMSGGGASAALRAEAIAERARHLRLGELDSVARIDAQIRQAHESPFALDLHYMSATGATKLVQEAIEAVRYMQKSATTTTTPTPGGLPNRITVVTGAGNNSRNGAQIKPKVMDMLRRKNIQFDELNAGCLCLRVT